MNFSKSLLSFTLVALSATGLAHAELKLATVDIAKLFDGYYKTAETQKVINLEKAKMQKENDERMKKIQELKVKFDDLRKKIEDPALPEKKKIDFMKSFEEVRQEATALERERLEFIERRTNALKEKANEDMRIIFNEINEVIKVSSKSDGYDYVFNKAGIDVKGVPFLLYSKDASDITEKLAAKLAEKAPK